MLDVHVSAFADRLFGTSMMGGRPRELSRSAIPADSKGPGYSAATASSESRYQR